jgi:hypothetical protein
VRKIIKFDKRPRYDSKGRNGFIMTTGIEIADLGLSQYLIDDPSVEAAITLHPLDSRGNVSKACRLSIARSALPDVIAALQEIAGHDANKSIRACRLLVQAYAKDAGDDAASVEWEDLDTAYVAACEALGEAG